MRVEFCQSRGKIHFRVANFRQSSLLVLPYKERVRGGYEREGKNEIILHFFSLSQGDDLRNPAKAEFSPASARHNDQIRRFTIRLYEPKSRFEANFDYN